MENNEIIVSVVCNTYNHEKYIRDALEGFVTQKTTFTFEVLIHDDASTDATADIIREYEKKYPDIIKPIYEAENQYSKGDGSLSRIQYGRVKGKYIALCEGDDYWIDQYKLQKQVTALQQHPELDICACGALTEYAGRYCGEVMPAKKDSVFTTDEVILGGGDFVATASILYRTDIRSNPLPFFETLRLDYTIQILGSLRGGMLFLHERMAVYRLSTIGSWTRRMEQDFPNKLKHLEKVENMLCCLDKDTKYKFHDSINTKILKNQFKRNIAQRNYVRLIDKKYRVFWGELSVGKRIIIILGSRFPNLVRKMENYQNKWKWLKKFLQ